MSSTSPVKLFCKDSICPVKQHLWDWTAVAAVCHLCGTCVPVQGAEIKLSLAQNSEYILYVTVHSAGDSIPLLGLSTGTTLHCSRISYREEVHSNRTCRLIKSLLLFPPPQLLLLYSISLGRAGAVPAPSSFSPLGTGWSQYTVAPHQCDCSAAHRSRAEQSRAGGKQRKEVKRRRRSWSRTVCLPSDRREYTLWCPVPSTCPWGVKDSLGLAGSWSGCCLAPGGQVRKVSVVNCVLFYR